MGGKYTGTGPISFLERAEETKEMQDFKRRKEERTDGGKKALITKGRRKEEANACLVSRRLDLTRLFHPTTKTRWQCRSGLLSLLAGSCTTSCSKIPFKKTRKETLLSVCLVPAVCCLCECGWEGGWKEGAFW